MKKRTAPLSFLLICLLFLPSEVQAFWGEEDSHPSLQSDSGYDVNTVITVSGEVQVIRLDAVRADIQIEIDVNGTRMLALLGPHHYWNEQRASVHVGDRVTVRGSKAQGRDGVIAILAREIETSPGVAVELRDEFGHPLWEGGRAQDDVGAGSGERGAGHGSGHGGGGGGAGGGGGGH